uniref:glucuronosyltransferase n=1 Tax=Erpetoichthys calabaricus TaxID=27687 RepID=A0A8C4T3T1_ERPCA
MRRRLKSVPYPRTLSYQCRNRDSANIKSLMRTAELQSQAIKLQRAVAAPRLPVMTPARLSLTTLLVLLACGSQLVTAGKVLIWPGDYSHWISLQAVTESLVARGHAVTVLVHSATKFVKHQESAGYDVEVFDVSFTSQEVDGLLEQMMSLNVYEYPSLSYWQLLSRTSGIMHNFTALHKRVCDGLFRNRALLDKLRASRFDVLLSDPVFFCSELVAVKFGIPFIYTLRFSMAYTIERQCGQMPAPPSFVPAVPTLYTDKMSFLQRSVNFFSFMAQDVLFTTMGSWNWNAYYSDMLGRPTSLCEMMGKAEIWLIRTYWDFEFPRPYLPNFQFVGGLHCRPAKALPEDMEEFAQSSGDHGIVVLTFGSMIKNLTREKANLIASALGQIPQKVLWRYSGETPETLAPNTRLYNWIPQNDLLGHPKTRAFITHGGTNGIYEAIYHGIPMVGIPMFGDQPDNMVHMKAKGAAVVVNFNTMTSQDLVDALNTVINNPTYKESAMKLSRIHHDQPVKPLDTAVFWIEFVMRHKGAKHLRPAAHNLTWYQYHCLDVIAFLLVCILTSMIITYKCCIFSFRKCFKRSLKKSKRE